MKFRRFIAWYDEERLRYSEGEYLNHFNIFSLFVISFFARLYVCFFSGLSFMNTDTYVYLDMARAIRDRNPISYFPNGYPIIIFLENVTFGDNNLILSLRITNLLLSIFVVLLFYKISKFFISINNAFIVALIVSIWPNQLNYTRQLLSEVPCEFFLMISIYYLLKEKVLIAGILISISVLIRSEMFPIIPLICIIFMRQRKYIDSVYLLFSSFIFIFGEFLLISYGYLNESSNFGSNLVIAISSNSYTGIDFSARSVSEQDKLRPVVAYISFAFRHPFEFLWQRISAFWELWGPWPSPGDPKQPRTSFSRILIGIRFPIFCFALLAVWRNRYNPNIMILVSPILVVTIVHVIFFSTPRFTFSVEPLALLLAAIFILDMCRRQTHQGRSPMRLFVARPS